MMKTPMIIPMERSPCKYALMLTQGFFAQNDYLKICFKSGSKQRALNINNKKLIAKFYASFMQSKCTLFHEKQLSFEGGEARTKLHCLRGRKLPPFTLQELGRAEQRRGQREGEFQTSRAKT